MKTESFLEGVGSRKRSKEKGKGAGAHVCVCVCVVEKPIDSTDPS